MPTKNAVKAKQEIVIVMDKSGSMGSCRDDVIGGFNTYINDLKNEKDVDAKLTLVMFDSSVHKLYGGKAIKTAGELCQNTYCPNGMTALNDAVMEAIDDVETRLKKSKAKNPPQVIVIVFTDGEENSSRKFTKDDVNKKRTELEKEGWAFIFMGADMDAWAAGRSYGISAGNTVSLGKNAIADSVAYLSNRTSKAASMQKSYLSGTLDKASYLNSTQTMMSIDEDDLANDEEAVKLRNSIDSSSKAQAPKSNWMDILKKNTGNK